MSGDRGEELKKTPLNKADPTNWPDGVRPIALDEMDSFGVDRRGVLHWNGHPVLVQKGIKLSTWQSFGTILIVLFTIIGGVGAAAQGWAAAHQWSCQIKLISWACPPALIP